LASLGLANGEVGQLLPVAALAPALRARGLLVHTDAAQAVGRVPVDVRTLDVDLLSVSSHKLGGPVGVGALWVRRGVTVRPQHTGGPQERDRRAGTEPVAAIVGFAAALTAATRTLAEDAARIAALRDRLWDGLAARVPQAERNTPPQDALPNTLNVTFPGCPGESLLVLLDLAGIAVSLGSACAAASPEPSHTLLAMGRDREAARRSLRLSLGPTTTADEIERVLAVLPGLVADVRARAAA
jgi:cysteine desulfurase